MEIVDEEKIPEYAVLEERSDSEGQYFTCFCHKYGCVIINARLRDFQTHHEFLSPVFPSLLHDV